MPWESGRTRQWAAVAQGSAVGGCQPVRDVRLNRGQRLIIALRRVRSAVLRAATAWRRRCHEVRPNSKVSLAERSALWTEPRWKKKKRWPPRSRRSRQNIAPHFDGAYIPT